MKEVYSVTLLLLAIFPVLLQGHQPASVCRLETKYDRFADTTTVQCVLIERGETPAKLSVQANASFQGKEPNETAKFWLSLSSNRSSVTRHTPLMFREATTLYLSLDAARLELPVKDYSNDFYELIGMRAESARAEIGRPDLQKVLDAKRLAGEWGGVEFGFSDAALASLKDFINRQVFAAHNGNQQ